jgi:hypothetical protein
MEVFAMYRGKKVGMKEMQLGVEEQPGSDGTDVLEEEHEDSNVQCKWVRPVFRLGI